MAADTANQKVFTPLQGVLKLQDELRRIEQLIEDPKYTHDQRVYWHARRDGLTYAIQILGLPIQYRSKMEVKSK